MAVDIIPHDPVAAEISRTGAVAQALGADTAYPEIDVIPYPDPPDPAVYYGLAGDIVRAIEPHTEADPVALLGQILVAYGNAIGRTAYYQVEATRHYLNEFLGLAGATSKARKGTSWGHVRRLFEEAEPVWVERISSGLSSGEGLIWAVRDAIITRDKKGNEHVDPGIDDKRLLAYEAELGMTLRVLVREGNTLSAILRDAWETGSLSTLVKNNPARATGAHISIIGHITREELRRYIDATELANGFVNRFLFLAVRRSKLLPDGGDLREDDLRPLVERLREAIEFGRRVGRLHRDEAASAVWHRVYGDLSADRPGLLGSVLARAEAHVTRLSCIYALLDRSAVVRRQHLEAALALWDYAEASAKWIFGDAYGDPVADTILQALRETPDGLSRTQINDLFGGHRTATEIALALGRLLEAGKAKRQDVPGRGRTAERWYYAAEKAEKAEKAF